MAEVLTFTQIFEFAMAQIGEESTEGNIEAKYKALVNETYLRDLALDLVELDFMREDMTPINAVADYTTGTVAVTNASTTVTGTSTVWTAAMATSPARKFQVDGTDDVYQISTRDSNTQITLARAYQGATATGKSYKIYQDLYDLDTDLFVPTLYPGVYYLSGGAVRQLSWLQEEREFFKRKTSTVGVPNEFRLDIDLDTDRSRRIEINPPADTAITLYGEFVKRFTELYEYTTGTATTTQGSTSVTGTLTRWNADSNIATGDFFRIDSTDPYISRWYRVPTITSNTAITLASNFQAASQSGKSYTIASIPDMPREIHHALKWAVCRNIALSLGDTTRAAGYDALYQSILGGYKEVLSRSKLGSLNANSSRMRTVWERPALRRTG